jgi:hypothetical protein
MAHCHRKTSAGSTSGGNTRSRADDGLVATVEKECASLEYASNCVPPVR